ncbi:MAG: crotonase/enoyl-CoA hydratase family protein [Chloroflexi bacterium]|nr:crotonase/enoyl-CoA hydratase family protein [Chloroflexota bacterium]
MPYENVLYKSDGGVAWVTLNRPQKLNALNTGLIDDLWSALREAENDEQTRVIVIRGAGRAFCAGYDLTPSPERYAEQDRAGGDAPNLRRDIQRLLGASKKWQELYHIPKPVICQVHGYCLAAGTDIALSSDIRIVAEDAQIGFPPVRNLGTPATHMWTYLVGPQWTKWVFFTGDNFDGKTAERMGWALKAVPADKLEEETDTLARRIARVSWEMLACTKEICNMATDLMGRDLLQHLAATNDAISHQSTAVKEFHRRSRTEGLRAALAWMNAPFQEKAESR